ncbi:uncharacterized protein RAG0_07241 [Rhynchosporium agropyri]|uniref:Uncharacterized protein n=1 Tax=Rhynchosporium agropyri TaxID=914238 RepID=A0A1E1KKK6_9HELO|nr:uncharacterized protein RAG0_07241 [Rhynchosporium agropyri]
MTLEIKVERKIDASNITHNSRTEDLICGSRAALFDYRKAKAQAKLQDRGDAEDDGRRQTQEDGLDWYWIWANEAELQHYCNSLN